MPSNNEQRRQARRALMEFPGVKVETADDGQDEIWTPKLGEASGEPVRVTPGMSPNSVYTAFKASCAALANG